MRIHTILGRDFRAIVELQGKSFMTDPGALPMALRAAYLAMHRQSDAHFAPHGVTADQFVLLATLSRGNALTQRELAKRMTSDPSTVRAMLVLLEKQGFVQREMHPSDSRARTVALTAAGKRKFRQVWHAGNSIRSKMLDAIQPADAAILVSLLSKISEALNGESLPQSSQPQAHQV